MLIEFSKYKNLNCEFLSMDDEDTFNHNLKTMSSNWVWRHKDINYTTNSQGYRCKEFTDVNWSNYFLSFGDSNIFGIGSQYESIFPNLIASQLPIEAVNLGIPGSGTDVIQYNILNILTAAPTPPKFIVIVWPNIFRKIWFQKNKNYLWIPQLSHQDSTYKNFDDLSASTAFEEDHVVEEFQYRRKLIKMLCNYNHIKLIDIVLPYESNCYSKIPDIKILDLDPVQKLDYNDPEYFNKMRARDYTKKHGSHYGPVYHQLISDYVVNNV